jgi:hypothetical protein
MMRRFSFLLLVLAAACGSARNEKAPPAPAATSAPVLAGQTIMIFPVQQGFVPNPTATQQHYPLDSSKLDAELAYWLPQVAGNARWILPATTQRAISRSPTLGVNINNLAVGAFQRAQVKRIGDPLFGDLRKLAAVLDAPIAVIPVAAEFIGLTQDQSRAQIATAVIDALNGTVLWFGVIESEPEARGDAAIASAAQVFARTFAGKKN